MSTTVKLLDIEDTSTNSQYGMGLRNTAHAFVEALKIFDDAKRADRKDWKQKAEHKGDKCFNKHFPIGKVYYLKKTFNLDMDNLFTNHWNEIQKTPEWNSNVHTVEVVDKISDHADIIHYTTSEVVVIKGRDFVVCRMWRKVGDSYVVCATSFETDIAVAPKKKRGWVNVCAGKFTPLNSDPTKSLVEYLVSVDLKDKITPKAVISSGIAEMLIKDARNAFKYVEEEIAKKAHD
ncbi:hypothetical protein Q1695_009000 [Nippostrongylus brasiliensis]|nr:hypothetical protein Q1695_009000 [Nippostrongylus brasiliensis]